MTIYYIIIYMYVYIYIMTMCIYIYYDYILYNYIYIPYESISLAHKHPWETLFQCGSRTQGVYMTRQQD